MVRLKEHIEKFQEDLKNVQTREYVAVEKLKKCERQLRECKDDVMRLTQRESDLQGRRMVRKIVSHSQIILRLASVIH